MRIGISWIFIFYEVNKKFQNFPWQISTKVFVHNFELENFLKTKNECKHLLKLNIARWYISITLNRDFVVKFIIEHKIYITLFCDIGGVFVFLEQLKFFRSPYSDANVVQKTAIELLHKIYFFALNYFANCLNLINDGK